MCQMPQDLLAKKPNVEGVAAEASLASAFSIALVEGNRGSPQARENLPLGPIVRLPLLKCLKCDSKVSYH